MKKFACIALILFFCGIVYAAEGYLVIEGRVDSISAKTLEVKKLFYPVSPFAQVFDKMGKHLTLATVANIGYIDKARIYLLGGKVEKIVVLSLQQ